MSATTVMHRGDEEHIVYRVDERRLRRHSVDERKRHCRDPFAPPPIMAPASGKHAITAGLAGSTVQASHSRVKRPGAW